MKRTFLIAALALFTLPAMAADLVPLKAPPKQRILLTYNGAGMYYGLHTFAENQKIDVSGATTTSGGILSGLGGTFAVGAAVGLTGGYMWGDGTSWKAVEAMVSYKNIGTDTVMTAAGVPASMQSNWSFTERFKLGGPLASALNLIPNLSTLFPVFDATSPIPGGIASTTHPYIFGAFHQDDVSASFGLANGRAWKLKGGAGIGAMTQLASGVVMDVWAEYIPASSGVTIGAPGTSASVSSGRESRIGAAILW